MSKKLLLFALMSLCVIALSACKGNEEKLKGAPNEQKVDEDKKVEEEKRKQEEQQKVEEEKRKQEEQQKAEEEKRKQEEQQKAEEEKRKQEEQQRVEEEKRKQEEQQRVAEEKCKQEEKKAQQQQSTQQERTQKQEKPTQATGGKPTRSQISVGSHVVIQLDNDYSKTVSGVVKDILTHSETHTYGIKVRLQDGQIGRVQSVK
ncbi:MULTISPECIES: YwbE family protein [unclassified Bacillus cereus group]|uniref:YwbE family protein n=1 Tax=unclassified Bacillus cereus group TaxID=2750818 RepID=UPI0022E228F0|nr:MULTISPECIES: YwbE family protein [unclassified Bacillus cereus group]MDA2663328.1 YwbE family protein [Bacillus cereus group sp. Bc032]MDA2674049.1 YwbE family protein [Bacillus cereus group sp. Bc031]MDA2684987.1 YwbE family protein [Bacillus cereus group sp. Bc030]MDA2745969.1 YwbE family protein [Bacillus cereus group sp. Bc009]